MAEEKILGRGNAARLQVTNMQQEEIRSDWSPRNNRTFRGGQVPRGGWQPREGGQTERREKEKFTGAKMGPGNMAIGQRARPSIKCYRCGKLEHIVQWCREADRICILELEEQLKEKRKQQSPTCSPINIMSYLLELQNVV